MDWQGYFLHSQKNLEKMLSTLVDKILEQNMNLLQAKGPKTLNSKGSVKAIIVNNKSSIEEWKCAHNSCRKYDVSLKKGI